MKEHPIIFNGEMVRAILEGRKTQTRRVMKDQPLVVGLQKIEYKENYAIYQDGTGFDAVILCPFGDPGDWLWVKETYKLVNEFGKNEPRTTFCFPLYKATNTTGLICGFAEEEFYKKSKKWQPSLFMPKTVIRITLEIVNIRVERVQEITPLDAVAEGCSPDRHSIIEFRNLWNSINAKRGYGWDVNPWVWVIEFRRIEPK